MTENNTASRFMKIVKVQKKDDKTVCYAFVGPDKDYLDGADRLMVPTAYQFASLEEAERSLKEVKTAFAQRVSKGIHEVYDAIMFGGLILQRPDNKDCGENALAVANQKFADQVNAVFSTFVA